MRPPSCRLKWSAASAGVLVAVLLWAAAGNASAPAGSTPGPGAERSQPGSALATVTVGRAAAAPQAAYDGVVQAVRQTAIAAQVSGAVVALQVKAGDAVQAGQVLLRLDARAAEQTAAAGAAQVRAAQAAQDAATRDFQRQQQLFQQGYISRAALDRAESQYKSSSADAAAQLASAGAARTQSDFHVIRAPYAGVASEVNVVLGDMAMPGRTLATVYDPGALRVAVAVPQTVAAAIGAGSVPVIELQGAAADRITPVKWQWLPAIDPATHSRELRLDLPAGLPRVAPGQFARVWLPLPAGAAGRLSVPAAAVVQRAELAGLYVVGADGKPMLRQVRLGRAEGGQVEILSGVSAGERVALDPQAAARVR